MDGKIYEAINGVMADVGAVGKNSYNEQQRFRFRGIDAIMNALYPALTKHKVFVVPEVLEQTREERESAKGGRLIYSICKIKYTFFAEDGSSVSAVTIGEGMDSGDKATNKAMAIALKYAFFQVFCIPTEEMIDPDAESPEIASQGAKKGTPEVDLIGERDIRVLEGLCEQLNLTAANIFPTWPKLTSDQYVQAMNYLKAKIEKSEKRKA